MCIITIINCCCLSCVNMMLQNCTTSDINISKRVLWDYICYQTLFMRIKFLSFIFNGCYYLIAKFSLHWWNFCDKKYHVICKQLLSDLHNTFIYISSIALRPAKLIHFYFFLSTRSQTRTNFTVIGSTESSINL